MKIVRALATGAAAGAAGTTALNTLTYLDMVWRARPASSTPEATVEKLANVSGVRIPGNEEERTNRIAGLGPLTGLIVGAGVGAVLGSNTTVHPDPQPKGLMKLMVPMINRTMETEVAQLTNLKLSRIGIAQATGPSARGPAPSTKSRASTVNNGVLRADYGMCIRARTTARSPRDSTVWSGPVKWAG